MEDQTSAGQMAGNRFKEGYNCAEAVLRAFRDKLELGLSDDVLKIATGFGGGIGQSGCLCGALTGAIMVLNLLEGRNDVSESRSPAYISANEFHKLFTESFGGTCCRVLNPYSFGSNEQRNNCLKITAGTGDLLMGFINERGFSGPRK